MQINRTHLFIIISSVALLIVLMIQVSWILQTAKIREELFNEKANMILSKTAEALSYDKEACKNLRIRAGRDETRKIDSLFDHYMKFYNIHITYYFEVNPGAVPAKNPTGLNQNDFAYQPGCYKTCLEGEAANNALELKLVFPEKRQFILAEMGTLFITSVILILVVLVISWRTIISLMKEKKISEHTTDFVNNMTHEFKTPLTNIALAGKMLMKDSNISNEDKVKHYSGIILEENEKLRLQVDHVLSMTALERGEIPLTKTTIDFHRLIHDVLKSISIQVENRNGSIKLILDASRFEVTGDQIHLSNALSGLIDNAVKYSRENPEIVIQTSDLDRHLVIDVSDNGIGIEKEFQKKVFDKFFRVPTGDLHDAKGFGLGLSIIRRIIELHGGTIELTSEKGKGTTFTIRLPNV